MFAKVCSKVPDYFYLRYNDFEIQFLFLLRFLIFEIMSSMILGKFYVFHVKFYISLFLYVLMYCCLFQVVVLTVE